MVTGQQIVDLAMTQTGKRYVFGVENDSRTVETATAWDCSELVQIVCRDLGVKPVMPDGAYWQWRNCKQRGTLIAIERARTTPGALLFIGPGDEAGRTGRDAIWHVAISRGDDTTIEAKSTKDGTGTWPIGKRFTWAALIPGVDYARTVTTPAPPSPPAPAAASPQIILEEDTVKHSQWLIADGTQVWLTDGLAKRAATDPGDDLAVIADKLRQIMFCGWAHNAVKPDGVPEVPTNAAILATIPTVTPAGFPPVYTGTITMQGGSQ